MIFTVAIDGPAASGKGTIAKALAQELGFGHLDTGLLYRAVAVKSLDGEDPVQVAQGLDPGRLDSPRLRHADVAQEASRVAAIPAVRMALLDLQKAFARREGGAVMDGRDIGTVICPEAEAKLFVTASAEARAGRRFRELVENGQDATLERTLAEVVARDARDAGRDVAPLRPAGDAVVIDTSGMGIDEAVAVARRVVRDRLAGR